ncbi:hypothetical protein J5F11_09515, partial [Lactobacillus delbrueckii subsp. bulgaricus]|uniref:hypothetical protein n=1 Tax=Lactobacillus delbrueckii TaxID=1584 RepID=UPI001AAFF4CF
LCQESIKSAIDKAREALQYTGDDLTQLYHVFDESIREKYVNRDYVLTHFQEALDKLWIKPYYQMETRRREDEKTRRREDEKTRRREDEK